MLFETIKTNLTIYESINTTYNGSIHFTNFTDSFCHNKTNICGGSTSNINFNDNQLNISLYPNETIYFLIDYNYSEGTKKLNDPINLTFQSNFTSQDFDTKTYYLNNTLKETLNNFTLIINSAPCLSTGDTLKIGSKDQNYSCNTSTNVHTITATYLTNGINQLIFRYNKESGTGGGGGSSSTIIAKSLGIYNLSKKACELTYDSANKDSNRYIEINDLIELLELEEGKKYSWTTIRSYIDNWQEICSDTINRTLNENLVCEEIYYFILGNNWNYTYQDLLNLKSDLKPQLKISADLIEHYIEENNKLCYSTGLSSKLPKRPTVLPIKKLFNYTNCSTNLGNRFFDWDIIFRKDDWGKINCDVINSWRWLLSFEKSEENYYFRGIKLAPWIILVGVGLLIWIINKKSSKKN